jgi:hypothetical protein
LLAALLLLVGLVVGLVLGRSLVTAVSPLGAPVPAPTVTVTAEAPEGVDPFDEEFGPPESLQDLAQLPEYSGRVKDRALAEAGGGSPPDTSESNAAEGSGSGSSTGSGSGSGPGSVEGEGSGTVDAGRLQDFTMRASLRGGPIILGEQRLVEVRVSNPNQLSITVDRLTVTVRQPASAGCDPDWLEVESYVRGSGAAIVVAAGGTRTLLLDAELVNLATVNQDACQGATFPLSLTGTART